MYEMTTNRRSVMQVLEITIERLSIEATERCLWDSLELFDGPQAGGGSPSMVRLCGFIVPHYPFVTSSNIVTIQFTSDSSVNYHGFEIGYRVADRRRPHGSAQYLHAGM